MNALTRLSILAAALFVIFSSSVSYNLTSLVLPTQEFGSPTRLGLIVHGSAVFLTFMLLAPHI